MTEGVELQKQRLKDKAGLKKPKKKPRGKTTQGLKKLALNKTFVTILISTIISSAATFYLSSESTEDSLNKAATGDRKTSSVGRVVDNTRVFPNPPEYDQDDLPGAHIGVTKDLSFNPKTSIAIGDSTISWGNKKEATPIHQCDVEQGTWAGNLEIDNLGCASYTTQQITDVIEDNKKLLAKKDTVFITMGSNNIRHGTKTHLDQDIDDVVSQVSKINDKAQIVFIGYLPSYINIKCMGVKDRNSARRLHSYHRQANYAMKDAAIRHGGVFIDFFHQPHDPCDETQALVKLPESNIKAHTWHTTPRGHRLISDTILGLMGEKKK